MAVLNVPLELACPHDGTPLRSVLFKSGNLHHCPQCAGCFLPGDVANKVDSLRRWMDREGSKADLLPPAKIACPLHHGPMHTFRLAQHQLDFCTTCSAFWFDRGELKSTEGPVFVDAPRGAPVAEPESSGRVADHALDIAIEIGLSWLD